MRDKVHILFVWTSLKLLKTGLRYDTQLITWPLLGWLVQKICNHYIWIIYISVLYGMWMSFVRKPISPILSKEFCIMTYVRCKLKKAANRPVSLRAAIAAYRKGTKRWEKKTSLVSVELWTVLHNYIVYEMTTW
jgi:hypothetical protein